MSAKDTMMAALSSLCIITCVGVPLKREWGSIATVGRRRVCVLNRRRKARAAPPTVTAAAIVAAVERKKRNRQRMAAKRADNANYGRGKSVQGGKRRDKGGSDYRSEKMKKRRKKTKK